MARLFFALWPDVDALRQLEALSHDVALVAEGTATPADKIHLTLAFLGEVPAERQAAVELAGSQTQGPAFKWTLDRVGSFRRARVAWAGTSEPPAALLELQSSLAQRLAEGGFALEERPFAPHLTLARKIAKPLPAAAIPPIRIASTSLALVVSDAGTGRYTTVKSWPLGVD
jgi:RNA 2',3'-cyclic 3'-phosphodiesterase